MRKEKEYRSITVSDIQGLSLVLIQKISATWDILIELPGVDIGILSFCFPIVGSGKQVEDFLIHSPRNMPIQSSFSFLPYCKDICLTCSALKFVVVVVTWAGGALLSPAGARNCTMEALMTGYKEAVLPVWCSGNEVGVEDPLSGSKPSSSLSIFNAFVLSAIPFPETGHVCSCCGCCKGRGLRLVSNCQSNRLLLWLWDSRAAALAHYKVFWASCLVALNKAPAATNTAVRSPTKDPCLPLLYIYDSPATSEILLTAFLN